MSIQRQHNPLTVEHFYHVDAATCEQTLAESDIEYSIDMGRFTIHHGVRWGAPIVIAEHHDQKTDELSGVWYDEAHEKNRKADNA
jgi:hypothetical protein